MVMLSNVIESFILPMHFVSSTLAFPFSGLRANLLELLYFPYCYTCSFSCLTTRFENPEGGSMRFLPSKFIWGGYKRVVKILVGGYTFWGFYCIFISKYCKNMRVTAHFYHPSPLCASVIVQIININWISNSNSKTPLNLDIWRIFSSKNVQ